MSRKEAVTLASRTLGLLMTIWSLTDLSYLPTHLHSYLRYVDPGPVVTPSNEFWRHHEFIDLGFLVVRILGTALVAFWLFRASPEVEQLLLPIEPNSPVTIRAAN